MKININKTAAVIGIALELFEAGTRMIAAVKGKDDLTIEEVREIAEDARDKREQAEQRLAALLADHTE